MMGLYKVQPDLTTDDLDKRHETWRMEIKGESVVFSRWINERPDEIYRSIPLEEAPLAAVAILQGFRPTLYPKRLDRPVRETGSECTCRSAT